jgi:hypothetical protein
MDFWYLIESFFKAFFLTIPLMIVWIAIKIKWKDWRDK